MYKYCLSPGSILSGKYMIVDMAGEYDTGIIYSAKCLDDSKPVFVKEFFPRGVGMRDHDVSNELTVSGDEKKRQLIAGRRQFLEEAYEALNSPASYDMERVIDVFEENNTAYMVTESVADERISAGRVNAAAVSASMTEPLDWAEDDFEEDDFYEVPVKQFGRKRRGKGRFILFFFLFLCVIGGMLGGAIFAYEYFAQDEGKNKHIEKEAEDDSGESGEVYYVTGCKDVLKVREDADEKSKVLAKLDNGEEISVIDKSIGGKTDGNIWQIHVKSEDVTGFIDRHYLTDKEEYVKEPEGRYASVAEDENLVILNGTDKNATSVGLLARGDEVTVLSSADHEMVYISAPAMKAFGYVPESKLSKERPKESEKETDKQADQVIEKKYFIQQGSAPAKDSVYYASVQTGYLALRTAQAFDASNEIGQIQNGEEVIVVDSSTGTYWWVYAPTLDKYGYVNSNYLRR